MHQHWISFIKDLDPGWSTYTHDGRLVMRYDDVSEPVLDPDGEERLGLGRGALTQH